MKINPWTRCPFCKKIHVAPNFTLKFTCKCGSEYDVLKEVWTPPVGETKTHHHGNYMYPEV